MCSFYIKVIFLKVIFTLQHDQQKFGLTNSHVFSISQLKSYLVNGLKLINTLKVFNIKANLIK